MFTSSSPRKSQDLPQVLALVILPQDFICVSTSIYISALYIHVLRGEVGEDVEEVEEGERRMPRPVRVQDDCPMALPRYFLPCAHCASCHTCTQSPTGCTSPVALSYASTTLIHMTTTLALASLMDVASALRMRT